jgi:hypothetical protein
VKPRVNPFLLLWMTRSPAVMTTRKPARLRVRTGCGFLARTVGSLPGEDSRGAVG